MKILTIVIENMVMSREEIKTRKKSSTPKNLPAAFIACSMRKISLTF